MGGLGNQMFIYAFAKKIELMGYSIRLLDYEFDLKKTSKTLQTSKKEENIRKMEILLFNLTKNNVEFDCRALDEKASLLKKILSLLQKIYYKKIKSKIIYDNAISYINQNYLKNLPNNSHFFGYFQNVDFFDDIYEQLLDDFSLKIPLSDTNKQLQTKIKNTKNSCFLHIRRGDFLDPINWDMFQLGKTYYQSAISILKKKMKTIHIFVFSNEIEWCKKNLINYLGYDDLEDIIIEFVDNNGEGNAAEEMELMRSCEHAIMANSTFSWWAGYLLQNKEKICIMPSRFFYNPQKEVAKNLVPKNTSLYQSWYTLDPIWGDIVVTK